MFYFISRTMNMNILLNIGRKQKKTELTYNDMYSAICFTQKGYIRSFFLGRLY